MKAKIPLIGLVKTGKDAEDVTPTIARVPRAGSRSPEKLFDILGGVLDLGRAGLSNEKTISSQLLEANKDWVYRNNDAIAQEVSKIDFQLYQVGLSKGEIVYTEIEEHPLLALLDKFNATTTKADGIYDLQSHKKLTGDAFLLLIRNGRTIEGLELLQPDKVTLDLGDPNKGEPKVKAYKYKDTVGGKQVEITYEPEEIIHFKKPNPKNQYRGLGAVEAMAETIDADNLANLVQKNFFKKGAITNFVLTTEGKITDAQLKRLKADLKANNAGPDKAWEALILSGGLKPAGVGYSNRDLQLIDLLAWYRNKIMIGFGNTPAALGIIEDVNRANSESTIASWKRSTVKPDMDAIVNTFNEFLVPLFGKNLLLGYVDPVPEDRTDDISEAVQLKNAGIITINEARDHLGYDTIQGGDIFAPQGVVDTPGSATPEDDNAEETPPEEGVEEAKRRILRQRRALKGLGAVPDSLAHIPDLRKQVRRLRMFSLRAYNHELKEQAKPAIAKLLKKGQTKEEAEAAAEELMQERITPYFTNDAVWEFYGKQIHTVEAMEKAFEEAIKKFIAKLEEMALSSFDVEIADKTEKAARTRLKKAITKASFTLFDDEAILTEAKIDLSPLLMNEVLLAGQAAYDLIDLEDTYVPYNIQEAVQRNVAKFTQSMLDTDRDTLTKLINDGLDEGLSVPQIRNSITDKFDDISRTQSTRITRTEVIRASNMGTVDAYKQSQIVEGKQWLVAAGADEECEIYDGEVVGLDENFYETSEFQNGDPPLHPNCRCVVIPVINKDKVDLKTLSLIRTPLVEKIRELEAQVGDKEKVLEELRAKSADDRVYIKALEKYLHVEGEDEA